MQPKTIIISAIVVVLLGGSLLIWWMLGSTPPAPPAQTNQTSTSYTSNQTSVGVPSQTQSQTKTQVDLDAAYNDLFQKILAQQVTFTPTTAGGTGSVYALYAQDIADAKKSFPKAFSLSIGIAMVDLDEDGVAEALVLENLPGYCGTAGCPFDIYKKEKGKWVNIFTTLTGENIGISNTYNNNFADIYLAKENFVVRYVWDGKQYNVGEVTARWDGSAFQLTQ
jgi:hypothetical protein